MCRLSSVVEQRFCKPWVASSNLSAGISARLIAATLCWGVAAIAIADGGHHSFWSAKGAHNTVYLLGSVPVSTPEDSDLPPDSLRAYDNAKVLVMELDLNIISPESLLGTDLSDEMLPQGQTLAE